jgi:hypothetical protein
LGAAAFIVARSDSRGFTEMRFKFIKQNFFKYALSDGVRDIVVNGAFAGIDRFMERRWNTIY